MYQLSDGEPSFKLQVKKLDQLIEQSMELAVNDIAKKAEFTLMHVDFSASRFL